MYASPRQQVYSSTNTPLTRREPQSRAYLDTASPLQEPKWHAALSTRHSPPRQFYRARTSTHPAGSNRCLPSLPCTRTLVREPCAAHMSPLSLSTRPTTLGGKTECGPMPLGPAAAGVFLSWPGESSRPSAGGPQDTGRPSHPRGGPYPIAKPDGAHPRPRPRVKIMPGTPLPQRARRSRGGSSLWDRRRLRAGRHHEHVRRPSTHGGAVLRRVCVAEARSGVAVTWSFLFFHHVNGGPSVTGSLERGRESGMGGVWSAGRL